MRVYAVLNTYCGAELVKIFESPHDAFDFINTAKNENFPYDCPTYLTISPVDVVKRSTKVEEEWASWFESFKY